MSAFLFLSPGAPCTGKVLGKSDQEIGALSSVQPLFWTLSLGHHALTILEPSLSSPQPAKQSVPARISKPRQSGYQHPPAPKAGDREVCLSPTFHSRALPLSSPEREADHKKSDLEDFPKELTLFTTTEYGNIQAKEFPQK